jgi:phosphoglycolate phosphatase-like HAD superfamily hydrolase
MGLLKKLLDKMETIYTDLLGFMSKDKTIVTTKKSILKQVRHMISDSGHPNKAQYAELLMVQLDPQVSASECKFYWDLMGWVKSGDNSDIYYLYYDLLEMQKQYRLAPEVSESTIVAKKARHFIDENDD